jgi:hypothetical protein
MSTRFATFILGLVAISALLFQPICQAAELHLVPSGASHATAAGGDEAVSCCSMLAPTALRTAAPLTNASTFPVPAPVDASPILRPHVVSYDAPRAAAPPLVLSYYLRSARIQR